MMPHEETSMAEVLRFPHRDNAEQQQHDGAVVHATAERIDPDETTRSESGAELAPDTAGRAVELRGRGPFVAGELTEKAKAAATATGRFTKRHAVITAKGMEAQRQQRKAERAQGDLKAARGAAAAAGDYAHVSAISSRMVEARLSGVHAWKERLDLTWAITKKAAIALTFLIGVGVVAGLVNAFGHWLGPWDALDVLYLVGRVIAGLFYAARFTVENWILLAPSALLVATSVWLSRRWRDGKRLGEMVLPVDLRRGSAMQHVELDESALVAALANIGLPMLKQSVKDGWPNRESDRAWVQFPISEGNGITASLRLPLGAPVEKVQKAKVTLAHNLGCLPAELWTEKNSVDPAVLDLFRLDPGELRKPVPAYPLLDGGTTDYFKGFPVGISPRGEEITGHVFERNYVISGIMGSGKSTLVLSLLTGAVLDPLVDIDVFVFAENADYDPLKDLFNTFVMGDTAENVEACQDHIAELHADLGRRGELLRKHGVNKVDRDVAAKEPGLRPRIVVIDECQSYFRQSDPKERREIVDGMVRFFSAARKYGITCVFVTPIPSDASLPRDLVSVTTNRACYAIGDKTRNNVVLGDKAHENGISALGLKPAADGELNDVGTSITVGFTSIDGTTLRTYYLKRGEQEQLAERAKAVRSGVSRQEPEQRDVLADVLEVCGSEVTRGSQVVNTMGAKWPTSYSSWRIEDLVAALGGVGYKVPSTDRKWLINPAKVADAKARRDAEPDTE